MTTSVVLDTNVFVAAGFNPRSASAKTLQRIRPLRARPTAELFRLADRFTAATHPERFSFILDPDDRKFAALAEAAGAILISNDEHLLRYRDRMDVSVVTPAAFWKRQQRTNKSPGEA